MKPLNQIATILFVFFSISAKSQLSAGGNNPSSIHWKYYETKAVKLIFPEGNEKEALRAANIINFIHDSLGMSVGKKRKHLDLLLQTNQVVSNGYVALAPYRSEFYATGLQDFNVLGSPNWLDLLCFHEYRHALQIANQRRGLTRVLSFVGGQAFWQLALVATIPNWYMEGDAVQTESLFSGAGRGRAPDFFKGQRALLLGGRNYRYMKARNGSFRHFVPDHYRLGYAIVHRVRNDHGTEAWANILRQGSSFRGIIYPFSKAMRRNAGYSTRKAYKVAYDSLRTQWEEQLKRTQLIPTTSVTPVSKRTYTDYLWAHVLDDGSMICRKSSFKRTGEIIQIKDGKEKTLVVLGIMTPAETYFSMNNGKLAWCEFTTDKRWQNRNYSEIRSYDLATKKKTRVTVKSKLFAPEFSSKGDRIVASRLDEHIKNAIVFIDPATGKETGSIPNPENDFVAYPTWTKDDQAIVFQAKRNSKIAILKYDLASQAITELTPWSQQIIGPMTMGKDHIYFTAAYTGINNIFAVSLSGDKVIRQISSVRINASMPFVTSDEKTLYLSEFDYTGDQITRQPIDLAAAPVIKIVEPQDQQELYKMRTTKAESAIFDRIPNKPMEAKDYKGVIRGAKLHSWSVGGNQTEVSLTLMVDNILNDFSANVKAGYNLNEKTPFIRGKVDYSRFYLPVSLYGNLDDRSVTSPVNLSDTGDTKTYTSTFTERNYGGTVYLPLKWIKGIYSRSFLLTAGAGQISTSKYKLNDSDMVVQPNTELVSGQIGLSMSNMRAKAYQNIHARFGQELNLFVGTSLSGASALKYSAQATLYFPGLMRNHSLYFRGGYKKEELKNKYRYMDDFIHARGYLPIQVDEEMMASANYQLPLCYPDFGVHGIFYLQRIRLNLFADYSQLNISSMNKTFNQNSYGFELYFDVKLLNALGLSLGARNSFLMDRNYFDEGQKSRLEFFFAGAF